MIAELDKHTIAESFSTGEFETTYPFLSESVEWNVIGEEAVKGIEKVTNKCKNIEKYFNSISKEFIVHDVTVVDEKVFVTGRAIFKNPDGDTVIDSCDIYTFDEEFLEKVDSYCIPIENK